MEDIWDKIGGIIAAIITALGGFYMYDRKVAHERLTKIEGSVAQNITDIKVIEARFTELKEDTEEIKESQKTILRVLASKRK